MSLAISEIALFLYKKSPNTDEFYGKKAEEISLLISSCIIPSMGLDPSSPDDCQNFSSATAIWNALQHEGIPLSIRETITSGPFETFELLIAGYLSVLNWVCQSEKNGMSIISTLCELILLMQAKEKGWIDTSVSDKVMELIKANSTTMLLSFSAPEKSASFNLETSDTVYAGKE